MIRSLLSALLALAFAAPAFADDKADMEAFMAAYLERWNAHDAQAITAQYYRLEGDHAWSTPEGMKALGSRQLQPGMPAEIIIKTGERSLLTYLAAPLLKRMAGSLKEE